MAQSTAQESRDYVQELEAARTPAERRRVYEKFNARNRAEIHGTGARLAKGALGAAMLAHMAHKLPVISGLVRSGRYDPRLSYAVGVPIGAALGLAYLKPREKAAGIGESRIWPWADVKSRGYRDTTVKDLQRPEIPEALRREILKAGVNLHTGAGRTQAFYGGRVIGRAGKIEDRDVPAVLAHELGHHRGRHLSKDFHRTLAVPAVGALLGSYVMGRKYSGHPAARAAGAALGAGIGSALSVVTTPGRRSSQEYEADRFAAQVVGTPAVRQALKRLHEQLALEQLAPEAAQAHRDFHTKRPDTAAGRLVARTRGAVLGGHPPLWARLEALEPPTTKS